MYLVGRTLVSPEELRIKASTGALAPLVEGKESSVKFTTGTVEADLRTLGVKRSHCLSQGGHVGAKRTT